MFVITIKDVETDNPIYKARYVMHGHKDRDKSSLVHDATTANQSSTKMLVSIAALFGFRLWTEDVSQAYVQSASKLLRDVYLKPSKELEIPGNCLVKLLRPLYGLADSGDYWHDTFTKRMKQDLGMATSAANMSLFFKNVSGQLKGLMATYVDDAVCTGDADFSKLTEKTSQMFETKPRSFDNLRFAGVYIDTCTDGSLIHQKAYIERIKPLPPESGFDVLRSARAQISWLIHTRPDICCAINKLAQVTQDSFDASHIKSFNKLVRHVKKTKSQGLKMQKLDYDSLHIRAYSDASFATNADLTSQLGFIIVMSDASHKSNVLDFNSYKSKRATRSVLGAEIYAFADGFDYAFTMKHDLESILGKQVPLQMFTDSKSLFDTLTKSSSTTERCLMIDVQTVRDGYKDHSISKVGFVRGPDNPADGLTRPGKCPPLNHLLLTGLADFPVEQWVVRNSPHDVDDA